MNVELGKKPVKPEAPPLQITWAGQREPISAQVLDLSRSGARFSVACQLDVDSEVTINLPTGDESIVRPSCICSKGPSRDGWSIEVTFREELSEAQFDLLAARGFVDRRQDPRIEHVATMTARWELESVPIPVQLMNLSAGGFKMVSLEGAQVGRRVLLETSDHPGSPIIARVQWQHEGAEGFEIGCTFVDKHGCGQLMQQLTIARPKLRFSLVPEVSTRQLLGLTIGVITVAAIGLLLTGNVSPQALATLLESYR